MLKEEISDKVQYVKELETALNENSLEIVPDLQQKVMHLEKSLHSKQLFCETLINELDLLKNKTVESNEMEQVQEKPQTETPNNQDVIDGKALQVEQLVSWIYKKNIKNSKFTSLTLSPWDFLH